MNKQESALPIELLRQLIRLDADTGSLYWLPRSPEHFASGFHSAAHRCANWNSRYANTPALACLDASGHLTGRIFNRMFYAHRVVYALTHGRWPEQSIDHENHSPSDNSPANLRDVCHQENHRNQRMRKNNTSGVTGVSLNTRLGKWTASITVNDKAIHLGFFVDKSEAISARREAELRYGFHTNHGRKAA